MAINYNFNLVGGIWIRRVQLTVSNGHLRSEHVHFVTGVTVLAASVFTENYTRLEE